MNIMSVCCVSYLQYAPRPRMPTLWMELTLKSTWTFVLVNAARVFCALVRKGGGRSLRVFAQLEDSLAQWLDDSAMQYEEPVDVADLYYSEFKNLRPITTEDARRPPAVVVFGFLESAGFYGGIATLLLVGAALARRLDLNLIIVQTAGSSDADVDNVRRFLSSNGISIAAGRLRIEDVSDRDIGHKDVLALHDLDIAVVSAWWDAHLVAKMPLRRKFLYLLQDFEPIFYNNGDSFVLADNTYRSECFVPLCNTDLLLDFFKHRSYTYIAETGLSFEPAPVPERFLRGDAAIVARHERGPKRLFLYGRPHVHRNLFFSAVDAIDQAMLDPRIEPGEWQLFSAGAVVPKIRMRSGAVMLSLGKMPLDEYYEWARGVDVAVAPMQAPHPNYPTLELAALGATVVTTKWETKQDLSMYSPNILMAECSADSIAQNLIVAMTMRRPPIMDPEFRSLMPTNWANSLDKPIDRIAEGYVNGRYDHDQ